jgi:hypothetical protein
MTLLIVFLPNIEMKNKLNHAVEIFNRYFPPDPGAINRSPASTPAPMNRGTSASGGHEAVRFALILTCELNFY